MNLPAIENTFVCIANIDTPDLTAIVSSYIYTENQYPLIFEFPSATDYENSESGNIIEVHQITRNRSRQLNIKIKNVLQKTKGCENLILIGIDEKQKSYLTFLDEYNVIDIQDYSDVDSFLEPFFPEKQKLKINESDIINKLPYALKNNLALKLGNVTEYFNIPNSQKSDVLILIEDHNRSSVVIAINYAISINADVEIIENPDLNLRQLGNYIEDWKLGNQNSYNEIYSLVYSKISHINFSEYNYLTVFTVCVPYSLILENSISITHVNINLKPDFLIYNNIYFEQNENINSSLVFSPKEFGADEEIELMKKILNDKQIIVQELIGQNATASNFDYFLKLYPYDLLHICSHGGEINGYEVYEEFYDKEGNKHSVLYDEVVTFSPERGKELIKVTTKSIFRKFNGFEWKSEELEKQNYPHETFVDMQNAIFSDTKKNRIRKDNIVGSASIKCFDFNYQAFFNMVASGSQTPIIFNNTCSSWSEISHSFINSGSRLYIGTLWNIDNINAKNTAEEFYDNVENTFIIDCLNKTQKNLIGTKDENIYIIWGLHFATFKKKNTKSESEKYVIDRLLISLETWKEEHKKKLDKTTNDSITDYVYWIASFLDKNYQREILLKIIKNQLTADNN